MFFQPPHRKLTNLNFEPTSFFKPQQLNWNFPPPGFSTTQPWAHPKFQTTTIKIKLTPPGFPTNRLEFCLKIPATKTAKKQLGLPRAALKTPLTSSHTPIWTLDQVSALCVNVRETLVNLAKLKCLGKIQCAHCIFKKHLEGELTKCSSLVWFDFSKSCWGQLPVKMAQKYLILCNYWWFLGIFLILAKYTHPPRYNNYSY